MAQPNLIPLFADVLYMQNIDVSDIEIGEIEWKTNIGNLGSVDLDILDQEKFKSLKESITRCINEYFYTILRANRACEIYITESWLNKTENGQYHHQHAHSNSVFSGVVYLDCDAVSPSGLIHFKDSRYRQIEFDVYEQNQYNSKGFSCAPKKGLILIWPSSIEHKVEVYKGKIPRISLAFNTFIKNTVSTSRTQSLKI